MYGINFSYWGPSQWTESDYNALKPMLSEFSDKIMSLYPSYDYSLVNLKSNDMMFYDSNKQTHEVHTLNAEHYVFIAIASFMVLSLICGTIYEVYK